MFKYKMLIKYGMDEASSFSEINDEEILAIIENIKSIASTIEGLPDDITGSDSYVSGDAKGAFDSFMANEPKKFLSVAQSATELNTKLTEAMTNIKTRGSSISSKIEELIPSSTPNGPGMN